MKIKKIDKLSNEIVFENGWTLTSHHEQDCCEEHYLDFASIEFDEVKDLDFDLDNPEKIIEKVEGYGIRLKPKNGYPVAIPGYAINNGYYSSDLTLYLYDEKGNIRYSLDISDCQERE